MRRRTSRSQGKNGGRSAEAIWQVSGSEKYGLGLRSTRHRLELEDMDTDTSSRFVLLYVNLVHTSDPTKDFLLNQTSNVSLVVSYSSRMPSTTDVYAVNLSHRHRTQGEHEEVFAGSIAVRVSTTVHLAKPFWLDSSWLYPLKRECSVDWLQHYIWNILGPMVRAVMVGIRGCVWYHLADLPQSSI